MGTVVNWNGTAYTIPASGEVNWASLSNFLIALGNNAAVAQEMKQAVRVATTTPVTVSATTDFAVYSKLAAPGAVAVNLPAGVDGQMFVIGDQEGDAGTNNITITPNGAETINGSATYVINDDRGAVLLVYSSTNTRWNVVARYIAGTIMSNPMTTTGDLIQSSSGTTPARLAAVATGNALISGGVATVSSWGKIGLTTHVSGVLPIANGGTNKALTLAAGAVVWTDADSFEVTAAGTNGMNLRSTGTTAPAFGWPSMRSGTDAYTITTTDGYDIIRLTGTTSRQIDLPAAASSTGRVITFINDATSSAVMTVARAGSDTIGPLAETAITLAFDGDTITLVSNGTTWDFVGQYFQSSNVSMTFTWNGSGGNTGSIIIPIVRVGKQVTVYADTAVRATTGTSSTELRSAASSVPVWATTSSDVALYSVRMRNNAAVDATGPGIFFMNQADSSFSFTRFGGAAFTNSASAGVQNNWVGVYFVELD